MQLLTWIKENWPTFSSAMLGLFGLYKWYESRRNRQLETARSESETASTAFNTASSMSETFTGRIANLALQVANLHEETINITNQNRLLALENEELHTTITRLNNEILKLRSLLSEGASLPQTTKRNKDWAARAQRITG